MAALLAMGSNASGEHESESDSFNPICFQDHASKLLRKLNETRKHVNFCDTIVSIGATEIPVQRGVLSAASHYFRALFDYGDNLGSSTQKEEVKPLSTVSLDSMGIDESTFHMVLDYIYTSQVALTPENIQDMLQAADQLLMEDLKDICCEYLDSCITTNNCIGIFDFTSQLSCSWSHHKVSTFLDRYFRDVSHNEEFFCLKADRVREFLSRKTIQMKQEDDVLDALLRWYQFDPDNRKEDTLSLFKDVIFTKQLSADSAEKLSSLPHIGSQCVEWIEKLKKDETECSVMHRGFTQVIVTCGGDGKASNRDKEDSTMTDAVHCVRLDKSMKTATPQSNHCDWIQLASLNTPRSGHGLVEVGGYLYVAGGRDRNCRILNSCEKYDPFNNVWKLTAPMSHARVGFGFVAIENNIYAIGGSNDITEPSTSMEVYDIFTDRWKSLPDMMMKRVWACCVAAGKKIYVLGGGIVEKFYDSVEVFDTSTLTWSALSPMRERRCDARAVSVGSDIFVFGGYRRIECPSAAHSGHNLKLCGSEFYSDKNDFWMPIQSRFGSPGMCILGERSMVYGALFDGEDIFVVGELDMNGEIHTIRSYNRHTNSWECVVVNPPPLQMHFPCCILSLPTQVLYQLLWDQDKLRYTDIVMKRDEKETKG